MTRLFRYWSCSESQVRTASGSHKPCGETDYQEQQSEFTAFFTPIKSPQKPDKWVLPKVALGYAGWRASPLWHFTATSKQALFLPCFPLFFSLSSPCSLYLPPSFCYSRNSLIPQPRVRKCNAHPADCPEPALTLHLPLGSSSQPHNFLHQTCTGTDLYSWNSFQNPYQGFPSPVTILTHTQP